ncbi:hypothetical protein K1719_010383 [Acacia pycnantha]|nr:hypothetical protein K1719_010383 [Acacia pycnantha]
MGVGMERADLLGINGQIFAEYVNRVYELLLIHVGTGNTLHAKCRRTFGQDHIFYINSISNNSDAQTFISADTFRINLSNLEVSDRSFNLIDMKPPNMQYALGYSDFFLQDLLQLHPLISSLLHLINIVFDKTRNNKIAGVISNKE